MTITTTQREAALRLADWLHASGVVNSEVKETIALLRELLAEPQGEPVAWFYRSISGAQFVHFYKNTPRFLADQDAAEQWPDAHSFTPLYTHPPQQRRPLTDEFVSKVVRSVQPNLSDTCRAWKYEFAQCKHWLDAAHGIGEAP